MLINAAVESENKSRTIKVAVKPVSGSRHPRTLIVMLGGKPSTKMSGLRSRFQYEERNHMVAEVME